MKCAICQKTEQQTELSDGIYEGVISKVCGDCAEKESIVLIKKPTEEQLLEADYRDSVRARMEKLSKPKGRMSKEQEVAYKNLSKLNFPTPRQENDSLIDNYDWAMKTARRRMKLTVGQVAEKTGVDEGTIEALEKGQLAEGFEPVIETLERFYGASFLRRHERDVMFTLDEENREKAILHNVNQKIQETKVEEKQERERDKKKEDIKKRIEKGQLDFSKKEHIENITLADLAELKRQKEKKDMIGDEVELDLD